MKKLMDKLKEIASVKTLLILSAGTALLWAAMGTNLFELVEFAPELWLDTAAGYTRETFYGNLDALGTAGRAGYLMIHLVDYLFITQFYTLAAVAICLLRKTDKDRKARVNLAFLPLAAGLADVLENISIDISILMHPDKIMLLGSAAPVFTILKFALLAVSFAVVLALAAYKMAIVARGNSRK